MGQGLLLTPSGEGYLDRVEPNTYQAFQHFQSFGCLRFSLTLLLHLGPHWLGLRSKPSMARESPPAPNRHHQTNQRWLT